MTPHAPKTRIKGASLIARLELLAASDPDLRAKAIACLSTEDRATLGTLLASSWYPLALMDRLDHVVADGSSMERRAAFRWLGRASAERNLTSLHAIFVSGEGPHSVLRAFPAIRRSYYSDGVGTYAPSGASEARLRIERASDHFESDCESTAGYFERAIELVGGTDAAVERVECVGRGHERCCLHCRWKAP